MAKYGLIGKNISYTQSPLIHSIIADYEYVTPDVNDEDELKAVLEDTSFDGFNVTIPYKQTVIKYMDELSDYAQKAGAVNTIVRKEDGRFVGYNTDVYGFMEMAGDRVKNRKCLIFGTGGAGRAVAVALQEAGAYEVVFVSRDPAKTDMDIPGCSVITYNELRKHCDAQVIINATPIGQGETIEHSPITDADKSVRMFMALELAVDLIYNPYRTKFLQDARRITGCKTMSGMEMLIHQAIGSRNIWLGDSNIHLFEKVATSAIKRKILTSQLNIVAVGMPGSGKSTIFRRYAFEMGLKFTDVDSVTEELMGEKIEDVLSETGKGEEYFREMEHQAVLSVAKSTNTVIASGGGTLLNPINRDILRANGIVIYIKRPLDKLAVKGRPISQHKGVVELFNQRDKIYRRVSDITLPNADTFGNSVDKNGRPNSFGYELKAYVFTMKRIIEKYIFDIAGNKWT